MRRLSGQISFESWKAIAKGKEVIGVKDSYFYQLLISSVELLDDESLEDFIRTLDYFCFMNLPNINKKFVDSQVIFLQEYIKRVEKTEEIEELQRKIEEEKQRKRNLEAQQILRRLREEWMKDPRYTGIKPLDKNDPSSVAEEDKYSQYTIEQFEDEIKFYGQRAIEADLEGDRQQANLLTNEASMLTDRMLTLKKKIKTAQDLVNKAQKRVTWWCKYT